MDRLLSRFSLWRDLRGGVWEQWYIERDTPKHGDMVDKEWFGPYEKPFEDRLRDVKLPDGAALSILRMQANRYGRTPEIADTVKPSLACFGAYPRRVEDKRVKILNDDR